MGKTAFLCVGEGAQRVGMGIDFVPLSQKAAELFTVAADASGLEVFDLCARGPAEELDQTQNAQPCLATTALSIAAALREKGIEPDCVAGRGVGEYAAHAIAGTIDDERALMLAARRGAMMAMGQNRGEQGMEFAKRNMGQALKSTVFVEPPITLYCSMTAAPLDVKEVNDSLMRQMTEEDSWDATLARMIDDGVTRFIECGPGKRLTDDVKRVAASKGASVTAISIGDALDLGLLDQ